MPDEAISLAAELHYTGYRHVMTTLWSDYGRATAEVAERVYADFAADAQLALARSAYALQSGVRGLRDTHPLTLS